MGVAIVDTWAETRSLGSDNKGQFRYTYWRKMKHCNFLYWQKTKRDSSFGKVMVSVFYYSRGVVITDYLLRG
jgi:hypothetical protein